MNEHDIELTMEQQFTLSMVKQAVETGTKEEVGELLYQTTALAMLRQNVIKQLIRRIGELEMGGRFA